MNLIEPAKNILASPKAEWLVLETESATPQSLMIGYVSIRFIFFIFALAT